MGRTLTIRALQIFLVLLSAQVSVAADTPSDGSALTLRTSVSEVRLTFFTTDKDNRTFDQLQPQDFAVVDDDLIVRKFRSFYRLPETKLQVMVMVDASESVAPRYRQEIADVLKLVSHTEWLAEDQVSVGSFGAARTQVICSGDCRTSPALSQLFAVSADGLTPLFDSVVFAADHLSEHRDPLARPVIILFSDGEDTFSRSGVNAAIQAALANDAQIYAVDVNDPRRASRGARVLEQMASATGGRYFPIRDGAAKVLSAILDDLHTAYVVTYQLPSASAGLHQIRILPTHNLNLQFRCRYGYYYPDRTR